MLIVLLTSCSTSVTLVNKGKYDQAIDVLVADLKNDPVNEKDIRALGFAFDEANKADNQKIAGLKADEKPENWTEIGKLYNQLDLRQRKIEALPETVKDEMHFMAVDYRLFIAQARQRICENMYVNALKLINSGNMADAQRAGFYLLEIDSIMPGYKDVTQLLTEIKTDTTIFIYCNVTNSYPNYLPSGIEDEFRKLDFSRFNTPKYAFVSKKASYLKIKIVAEIEIIDIKIIPEKTEQNFYTETATLQDGIAYKLDESGNFERDSLGNKMELPKFKTIACYVTENVQKKSVLMGGTVQIINSETGKIIAKRAVAGETKFYHKSAYFKGDINALSPETMELLGSKELEFPSDLIMILRASDKFGKNVADIVIEELEKLPSNLTKQE
jgi:hypothetical protein